MSTESTIPHPGPRSYERIGVYRILERLGEGGMGSVYLAEQQEPIRRRVALKLIKPGMDSAQVLARFESERQALALMSHSGVAKVFDAGVTPDGRPYFVMEHVAGLPITDYCDNRRLGLQDRLGLFVQTCEAIHHAHEKGIIHRDIKPSNILVAEQDGHPVAKVIDFGVAKATGQRLTERTLFTQHGVMIGTPEYMSPEQAGVTALEVDVRADVYSLGVLLYELLVGAPPFDLRQMEAAGAIEMLRILREKDPPKLQTRLNSLGVRAEEVALRRRTDVRTLLRTLRGELEWIIMRTLEKEPARRYASASELATDVGRYLAGQPVKAGPPTARYRIGKWIRRRRAFVAAAAVIAFLLLTVVVVAGSLHWKAERARDKVLRALLERVLATAMFPTKQQFDESDLQRLHREIEADPGGAIATLAYRAAAGIRIDVPAFGLVSEPQKFSVSFGDPLESMILPDAPKVLWHAEIEASWDGNPAARLLKNSWTSQEMFTGTHGLGEFFGPDSLTEGPHRLSFRATITRYPESVDRKNLEAVSPLDRETRDLGVFPVSLFSSFPPDFPHAVILDEPLESFVRVDAARIMTAILPPRTGKCFRFRWPDEKLSQTYSVCPPSGDVLPRDLIVGFELAGDFHLRLSIPIAMTASIDVPSLDRPVLSFDLIGSLPARTIFNIGLGRAWSSTPSPMAHAMFGNGEFRVDRIRGTLVGVALERLSHVTDLPRDEPVRGALHLTPSRSVALATRRMDRYLGNSGTIPIELTVSEVNGVWTDEVPPRSTEK